MQGKQINFTHDELNQIKDLYLGGESANQISKRFGCSHIVITRLAAKEGFKRSKEEARSAALLSCDHDYFSSIDTEEKAYWLGFLYADGNVTDGAQPSFQLCLSEMDSSHVYAFNKALHSEYSVGHYNYKNPVCQLRIPSKKLVSDLTALGCGPRKTFSIAPPSTSQVPESLVRHFIRGYFDGDGCKDDKQIVFLGTQKLLEWISFHIPFPHNAKVHQPKNVSIWRLGVGVKSPERDALMYEYLYSGASIWLERKRVKFSHSHVSLDYPFTR